MAQINAPKAFDEQSIEPKTLEPIKPLVEHINQNFDQLIRALFAQLTLKENFQGRIVTIQAKHRQPASVELQGSGVSGVSVLKVEGDGVTGLEYSATTSGRLSVTLTFMRAVPIATRSVDYGVGSPYAVYEVQSSLAVKVGDRVSISGFGNKNNNGEFLVIGRTSNSVIVFNNSTAGAAETKADFTGISEASKLVTLFLYG